MSKPCEILPDLWVKAAAVLVDAESDPGRRADLQELFNHRAAVCEFDGGMTRQAAERQAFNEVRQAVAEFAASADHGSPVLPQVRDPEAWDASDHAAVEHTLGQRDAWQPEPPEVPDSAIPPGWTRESWIRRLRQLSDACASVRPDLAAQHRTEADRLERIESTPLDKTTPIDVYLDTEVNT